MNITLIIGLVVGWYLSSHLISPLLSKFVYKDLNTLVMHNPMLDNQLKMQLSPQDIMTLKMQGVMV